LSLFRNTTYVCTGITISSLYFVVTGIQYWGTYYLNVVIKASKDEVYLLYSACSITAPTVGVLIGGFVTTTCIGGYTNKRALTVCFFVALLASLSALPIPWINNLVGVIICLWLVLFFGGFIMPNLTGILLNSVPPKERAIANSVANFFYNLLGYLPAPFLYGLVV
jgi:MFS family permease